MSTSQPNLPIAVASWLSSEAKNKPGLTSALDAIASEFSLDVSKLSQQESPFPLEDVYATGIRTMTESLESSEVFQKFLASVKARGAFKSVQEGTPEYQAVYNKVVRKYLAVKSGPATDSGSTSKDNGNGQDNEKVAEELKAKGNELYSKGEHASAVDMYSKALEASGTGPNSHVFYSNRAACHIALGDLEAAASDCSAAIALQPGFAKAHARLSAVMIQLGRYQEAKESAEKALSLDASNASALDNLRKAHEELAKEGAGDAAAAEATNDGMPDLASMMGGLGGGAGGMPDLASMMGGLGGGAGGAGGMPDMASMMGALGGGAGGMPDLGSMLNNPMIQEMMKNPQMMQMAQNMARNPDALKNMMSGLGGQGGPDLNALAAMMGGGGAPPGGKPK